jgi:chromosome segregation ATPase
MSAKDRESRETLAERVKDVEAQRDALHQALKSLLDRQAYQGRENEKRIRILQLELERAQQADSHRKLGYEREVRSLREEVNHLRHRADDALEQKWQCEKGLGGLKMDLDRAEQETSSLRTLLQEHDIALPPLFCAAEQGLADVQATSFSLETAYQQLQADMEHAEANVSCSLEEEQKLADQLHASVSRTEALAGQVRQQLDTNNSLRRRLADAISKGEREQQSSTSRINGMQNRLRALEDTVLFAQQHSEEEMAKHEDEIRALKESHNTQLMRARNGIRSPIMLSPRPPATPFSPSRSPRLDRTSSGDGMPLSQAVQTGKLETRVKELEKALRDADLEMEEVVGRMNKAQIEVAELQSDRYDSAFLSTGPCHFDHNEAVY